MDLTVKVQQSDKQLISMILADYADKINNVFSAAAASVKSAILDKISEAINNSSEVASLLGGDLQKELGLANPLPIVADLIRAIQESMQFSVDRVMVVNDRLVGGGYDINILPSDYRDVLSISDASYVTDKNVVIPWLNWLLFAGEAPLIYGFRIVLNPNASGNSRTGAIMVKSNGAWSIPGEFAGTAEDNFLTRAFANINEEISDIIMQEIDKRM